MQPFLNQRPRMSLSQWVQIHAKIDFIFFTLMLIRISQDKYNDYIMTFKNWNFVKISKKRGLQKIFGPIFGFYTKNTPRISRFLAFRYCLWYQKSRNARTSCICRWIQVFNPVGWIVHTNTLISLINVEVGINMEGGIFRKILAHNSNKGGVEDGNNLRNQ